MLRINQPPTLPIPVGAQGRAGSTTAATLSMRVCKSAARSMKAFTIAYAQKEHKCARHLKGHNCGRPIKRPPTHPTCRGSGAEQAVLLLPCSLLRSRAAVQSMAATPAGNLLAHAEEMKQDVV
eukprot:1138866-Pelagomonas_calceolata.AAC.7